MEKLRIAVRGEGTWYLSGKEAPAEIEGLLGLLAQKYTVEKGRQGPRRKALVADEGAEGNNHD